MSKITQRMDLRQSQQLVMTPQLQQAIKLLQLNNMELTEFIEEEIAQNPLLEKADQESSSDNADPEAAQDNAPEEAQGEYEDGWSGGEEPENIAQQGDFDPGSSMANVGAGGDMRFADMDDSFENRMSKPETLRDHLTQQLIVDMDDPRDRMIGSLLIDMLDEAGYLRHDMDELIARLDCSPERLENLLAQMREFDPPGVFAHDLADCLSLQLKEQDKLDAPMQTLLENLNMLADHDMKGLAAKCGVNETYLADMIAEIRALNPKPAGEYDALVVQTAIPDVIMKRLPKTLGGGWRVELNTETLPKVLINNEYYTEVAGLAKDKKDKEYINNQMNSANWLVRALDQRAQTILKVAGEIVEQQDAFFNYGIEFLKPLTLKDIAEVIEMHESTVSRVTTNKYIGTPRGIFELKYFFSTALTSEDGTSHSAESVRARVKTLIDEEDPKKILSDDKIVEILKSEGIDIARRTVAKYREALRIPSSVQRRKQKKNQAK